MSYVYAFYDFSSLRNPTLLPPHRVCNYYVYHQNVKYIFFTPELDPSPRLLHEDMCWGWVDDQNKGFNSFFIIIYSCTGRVFLFHPHTSVVDLEGFSSSVVFSWSASLSEFAYRALAPLHASDLLLLIPNLETLLSTLTEFWQVCSFFSSNTLTFQYFILLFCSWRRSLLSSMWMCVFWHFPSLTFDIGSLSRYSWRNCGSEGSDLTWICERLVTLNPALNYILPVKALRDVRRPSRITRFVASRHCLYLQIEAGIASFMQRTAKTGFSKISASFARLAEAEDVIDAFLLCCIFASRGWCSMYHTCGTPRWAPEQHLFIFSFRPILLN